MKLENMMKNIPQKIIYILPSIALICEILRQISFFITGINIRELFFTSSIMILVSTIIIHVFIVDRKKFSSLFLKSEESSDSTLKPIRFLNLMPIAMLFCTIADIILPLHFESGMILFLIAQLLYFFSFITIISLKLKHLFQEDSKVFNIIVIMTWSVVPTIIYLLFLFSPTNITTIVIIPYMIVLSLNGMMTSFALRYHERPIIFRLMLFCGTLSFFISDAILAINKFTFPFHTATALITPTYLLAIFLLQFAILSYKPFKEH